MHVSLTVWIVTIAVLAAAVGLDLWHGIRYPHAIKTREAAVWVSAIVAASILFGIGVWYFTSHRYGSEFFAGWITEYSLSVDNLFVFVIILTKLRVPRAYQSQVLLWGVVMALVLRGIFIGVGSAVINQFSWIFYFFGAFLVYTAVKLAAGHGGEEDFKENRLLRRVRTAVKTTDDYDGARLVTHVGGHRRFTPMLIVMVAIGSTDLLFALDSIPAIFGLTKEPYIVFTANALALLGLRQLYFLLGALMDRLVHLSYGLSAILAFIGVKMVFEALHGSGVEHIGPVTVPTIGIAVSLGVIIGVLAITTVTSLWSTRGAEPAEAEPVETGLVEQVSAEKQPVETNLVGQESVEQESAKKEPLEK
ncbi:TerC family protein [Catenulispora pinisilvae]|uniref:TerC family protein n=1 Tax=Catenulispora pinisilvae TaxID=2705253 RepID=UPI001E4F2C1D|nr:TerC family protein [Catenulispora pinisilvae]